MLNIWDDGIVGATQRPGNQLLAKLKQVLTCLTACPGEIIERVEVDERGNFADDSSC